MEKRRLLESSNGMLNVERSRRWGRRGVVSVAAAARRRRRRPPPKSGDALACSPPPKRPLFSRRATPFDSQRATPTLCIDPPLAHSIDSPPLSGTSTPWRRREGKKRREREGESSVRGQPCSMGLVVSKADSAAAPSKTAPPPMPNFGSPAAEEAVAALVRGESKGGAWVDRRVCPRAHPRENKRPRY